MTEPTAPIFRALADAHRRELLDRLFERDGQTLGELCEYLPEMTRFGVMKHLGVLEEANLVTTMKVGREKRHFLNPVPIRLVHDRWISKYAEPVVGAMSALKSSLENPMDTIDHIYSVYIKAAPDRVWRAITDGDETVRYYFGTRVASDWTAGASLSYAYPDGSIAADGTVLEVEPGRRIVMSFHPRWDPGIESEGRGPDDLGDRTCRGRRLEAHGHERPQAAIRRRPSDSLAGSSSSCPASRHSSRPGSLCPWAEAILRRPRSRAPGATLALGAHNPADTSGTPRFRSGSCTRRQISFDPAAGPQHRGRSASIRRKDRARIRWLAAYLCSPRKPCSRCTDATASGGDDPSYPAVSRRDSR